MKNKLISTENITLLLVLIIGILIAVIGYRNDPVITSKTTSDNAVESTELQITKTEESKNNDEVTKSLESESVETNEPRIYARMVFGANCFNQSDYSKLLDFDGYYYWIL